MTKFKGRHLGFLGLLCIGWATARVAIVGWEGTDPAQHTRRIVARSARVATAAPSFAAGNTPADHDCCFVLTASPRPDGQSGWRNPGSAVSQSFAVYDMPDLVAVEIRQPANTAQTNNPSRTASLIVPSKTFQPQSEGQSLQTELYAYSFWRGGNGKSGLAAGGQYGGGQSGLIATFSLQRKSNSQKPQNIALLVRTAIAHDAVKEREVALGVRWRPLEKLPVTITAERRFRYDREDAFAIYAAGGVSDLELPLEVRIDSFAQAGVVGGNQAGPFFDVFLRADRNVMAADAIKIHTGAGVWAGGQRGTARLDIGPSLSADVEVRNTRVRLDFDWRFRVAGDAVPGNGPALTLSTGF